MKLLLEIRDSDIFPGAQDLNPSNFSERRAVRAIVSNNNGQIALLKVGNRGYHKLPGGGIEAEEDMMPALRRELLEEIGCNAQITEYKNEHLKNKLRTVTSGNRLTKQEHQTSQRKN